MFLHHHPTDLEKRRVEDAESSLVNRLARVKGVTPDDVRREQRRRMLAYEAQSFRRER
jgi:hypothetical protein